MIQNKRVVVVHETLTLNRANTAIKIMMVNI
jgi:hypothetical protein